MSKPLVTVWCSAYNHEKYIAKAIEGFVMQETDFEVEIIVHDDASTDDTPNIIRRYSAQYPQIKSICLTENKFSVDKSYLNRIMFEKAQGKYIAMCEGDDYWTDPLKLQKQIDFLEENPDFSICFHSVKIVYEDQSQKPVVTNKGQAAVATFEDLASGNFIHTVSCTFRNGLIALPDWFGKMSAGDYPLHLLNANRGKIGFIDQVMAVYRIHHLGVWSNQSQTEIYMKWIPIVKQCRQHFYPRGNKEFSQQLANIYEILCSTYFEAGRYKEYRDSYSSCILLAKYIKGRTLLGLTTRFLISHVPRFAAYYSRLRATKSAA